MNSYRFWMVIDCNNGILTLLSRRYAVSGRVLITNKVVGIILGAGTKKVNMTLESIYRFIKPSTAEVL